MILYSGKYQSYIIAHLDEVTAPTQAAAPIKTLTAAATMKTSSKH